MVRIAVYSEPTWYNIIHNIHIFYSNGIPNWFLRLSSWQQHVSVKLFLQWGDICSAESKLSLLLGPRVYCTIHIPGIRAAKLSEVEGTSPNLFVLMQSTPLLIIQSGYFLTSNLHFSPGRIWHSKWRGFRRERRYVPLVSVCCGSSVVLWHLHWPLLWVYCIFCWCNSSFPIS